MKPIGHALSAVILLTACATSYDWKLTHGPTSKYRWIKAPAEVVRSFPNCESAIACAIAFPPNGVCIVVSVYEEHEVSQEIRDHEQKHCDGYAHA